MKQDVELEYSGRLGQALIAGFLFGAFVVFVGWQIIESKTQKADSDYPGFVKGYESCKRQGALKSIVYIDHVKMDRKVIECCSNTYSSNKRKCTVIEIKPN